MLAPRPIRYRLARPAPDERRPDLTAEQGAVVGHPGGSLRVLAGPGTGKTATLVEAVAERVQGRGIDPAAILVLTFSRRAAAELTERIGRRLAVTTREPMVRTLHSYAYALLRAAVPPGDPAPRLLGAGESDLMVRELLAGHAEAGGAGWPEHLRRALLVPAFARELRELLLRAAERQITPARIADLGRRHRRPEWRAVAAFIREYQQVGDLRQGTSRLGAALDQAELTTAALALLAEPGMLAAQQARTRRIFVDEYQDVDPAQARLIELLASGADELVVFGDPDQSIYAFRGSDPAALRRIDVDATVALTVSRRLTPALLAATRRVAARLPGPIAHRELVAAAGQPPGELDIRLLPSPARQADYIADALRRAHLLDGVPFARMAILVRSPAASDAGLRRACVAAGVPVTSAADRAPAVGDPTVRGLLMVLHGGLVPGWVSGDIALDLLGSPIGGMDSLSMRRLRRAVRAAHQGDGPSADLLAATLNGSRPVPTGLPSDLARPLSALVELLARSRAGAVEPDAEQVLWRIWQATELERTLVAASEAGGRPGQRADECLDAVMALFATAADLADRLPGAGVGGLLDLLDGQQIPAVDYSGRTGATRVGDAVAILSAHAAKGLQWDVVAVAGVQEGSWPDLRIAGGLLAAEDLLDAASGIPAAPPTGRLLADERRLFYVATTRARRRLIVTAVADEDLSPSRFLAELAGTDEISTGWPAGADGGRRRGLHLTALLAELRRVVTDPASDADLSAAAAGALARLAAAGVPGAHPRDWYGLAEPSTDAPPVPTGAAVAVSPSAVEALTTCALRAVLERTGARGAPGAAQLLGTAVHALAQGVATGVGPAELEAAVDDYLAAQVHVPPWQIQRTRRLLDTMTTAIRQWVDSTSRYRTFVGVELALDVQLPPPGGDDEPGGRPTRLTGRVDYLSRDASGNLVVTDFKSGASTPTRAEVAGHAQLAVYQLAVALGAFSEMTGTAGGSASPEGTGLAADGAAAGGGAELVYLRSGTPKVLRQAPLDAATRHGWQHTARTAAESLAAATVIATENRGCERCPVRACCPLQPEGRQVRG